MYGKDFDFLEEKEKLSKKDFPSKLLCSYMDFVHIFFLQFVMLFCPLQFSLT